MMWQGKIGVPDLRVEITSHSQSMFLANRSVRRLPEPDSFQKDFFKVLRDQPWTQSAFLSGIRKSWVNKTAEDYK